MLLVHIYIDLICVQFMLVGVEMENNICNMNDLVLSNDIDGLKRIILDEVKRSYLDSERQLDNVFEKNMWDFFREHNDVLVVMVSDASWISKINRYNIDFFVSRLDGSEIFIEAARIYALTMQQRLYNSEVLFVKSECDLSYFKLTGYQHRSDLEDAIATSSIEFACKYAIVVLKAQAEFVDKAIISGIENIRKVKNIKLMSKLLKAYISLGVMGRDQANSKDWIIALWRFNANVSCDIAIHYVDKYLSERWIALENALTWLDKPQLIKVLPLIELYYLRTDVLVFGDYYHDLYSVLSSGEIDEKVIRRMWGYCNWTRKCELENVCDVIRSFIITIFKKGEHVELANKLAWLCEHKLGLHRYLGCGVVYDLSTPLVWAMYGEESELKWHEKMLEELNLLEEKSHRIERNVLLEVLMSRVCSKSMMRIKGELIVRYLSLVGNVRCPLLEHLLIVNKMEFLLVKQSIDGTSYCSRIGLKLSYILASYNVGFAENAYVLSFSDCLWLHEVSDHRFHLDYYDYSIKDRNHPFAFAMKTIIEVGGYDVNELPLSPFIPVLDSILKHGRDEKLLSTMQKSPQWDLAKKITMVDYYEQLEQKYFPQFSVSRSIQDFLTK